ncbi:MAG TPA: glycosyl hydrolase family 65 protein [Acidimicrobiia bacterium]|nr:glycosyl hydrolase family 65 protein [Acidimicrobiia bacterium]
MDGVEAPVSLARRFEGVMFDWDGTAVTDRNADASEVRRVVERLCACGVDVAIVSGTHIGNVDSQLVARPSGPGRLLLALNRGSELFEVGIDGPALLARRQATTEEDAALTQAAEDTVAALAARGLVTRIVSERLNRRKIDLIPVPVWADPPKAQIDQLLAAVETRLRHAGIDGLVEVAARATDIARQAGLADPRVTSDAKHVEIGLTDKADSAAAVFAEFWADGIAPELVLIGGDEFGTLGGLPGSDSFMLVAEAKSAGVCSVGVEPNGVPSGVVPLGGGPRRFLRVLDDQMRRRADLPRIVAREGWSFVVDEFDPKVGRAREALLTIADGVIGTNGAPLFMHLAAQPELTAAGVYDGEGPLTDLLDGPRWATLSRALGSEDHVLRTLDLRNGLLGEDVVGGASVQSVRFSSFARPGIAVLRADVDPPDTSAALVSPDGPVLAGVYGGYEWMAARGAGGSITAAAWQDRDEVRLDRIAAYVVGGDGAEPERAVGRLGDARSAGVNALLTEHRRAWSRRWERADIRIEGDDELQLDVRLALFHLMASVADRGEAAGGARGITGHAYRGHVFWDADLFVLPFLAATAPAAARAMLEYRYRRLPAALAAARAEGRRGARFPWESAGSGFDVTPHSGRDHTGRVIPIRTGEAEVHIVGDVAWAASCYIDWTGDHEFALGAGRQILIETARYWASRIRLDSSGRGHLYGVIGPDEYHEPVDDNAYTNVLARWNLRGAAESAAAVDDGAVDRDEIQTWLRLAAALIDGRDPATGIYEQFAGFFELEPLLIRDIAPQRPITADLLLGRERVRSAQIVKQADVLMLHHLLPDDVEAGSLAANLDYYEPRTAHGSSLSLGIHASLFARAGRIDEAVTALRRAAGVDLDDLARTGAGGVHLGAMGSVWQALAYGFAGLRPRGDALVVDSRLPDTWSILELRVQFRGVCLALRLESEAIIAAASAPVVLIVDGRRVLCPTGETRIPRSNPRGA